MAAIITEIYISIDGDNYTKLDLHKDESVNMKHTQKDLQDLSKIFAPYSQRFTFPATPKNRAAFGFFGDTDAIKINTASKFPSKTYINGVLNNTGFIKLTALSYRDGKPSDFTGSFATTMTNLKQRIGEDTLAELGLADALVDWSVAGVQDIVRSEQTMYVDGVPVKYFAPLISINRVWGYDLSTDSEILDNIAYNPSSDLAGSNLIRPEELRPCIAYGSIIELIKHKYNLTVVSPIEDREEYADLRVWCNAERISSNDFERLPLLKAFGSRRYYDDKNEGGVPNDKKYTISENLADNTINVYKSPDATRGEWVQSAFQFRTRFNGVIITGSPENPEVVVQYVRASDDVVLVSGTFPLEDGIFDCVLQMDDALFGVSDNLEFYVQVKFQQPTSWTGSDFRIYWRYYDAKSGALSRTIRAWYYNDSLNNNNSNQMSSNQIDLIKSLPDISVVEFLESHFKAFNISIYDTSPDSEDLYWLTPDDVKSKGKVYSKAVVDYTNYADKTKYNKEKPNEYNYYNFKHAESEYFSNEKYAEAFGIEYGQTTYPAEKPKTDLNEFKVETDFSVIPPVKVSGARGVYTAYGFTSDDPEIIETGETRYTPNYDELTIFYKHGSTNCAALGLLGVVTRRVGIRKYATSIGVYSLTSYIKVMPWSKNGYSLGFSVLKFEDTEYNNSLYSRHYSSQTERLLNPNVLSQKFTLTLPPHEIYLNEATTIQGGGDTPSGFRLQNDIIIGEDVFSIVEVTIDQTTGKTKMTLLNY